jgi:two-component system nitrate/nitrite response regulator NarL
VVDDDPAFRALVARMLTAIGFAIVAEAGSVESALAMANARRFDSALVDVGLPDGNGISLARQLTALPWHPRVVLISTDPDAATAVQVDDAGAAAFIPKAELSNGGLRHLLRTP